MAVPGTGSTNQSLTFAAAKKLQGKAHTSNLKEVYNETIPSNIQLNTSTIFGQPIPTTVTRKTLYQQFSASHGGPATVEFVEFYVQAIAGTSYDANDGTFGDVGFAGGDEAQSAGSHGYQLVLTSSYQTTSSFSGKGSGFFINNQVVHQSNGGLQLINPLFGPQSNNKYDLELFTGHPEDGGLKIPTTSPADFLVDYFNGTIFVQDFLGNAVPRYARGFIYIGKFASTAITEAAAGGSLDVISGSVATYHRVSGSTSTVNLLDADRIEARDITGTGEVTLSGLSAGTAVTTKYLALDSNNNIVLTSSAEGSGGDNGAGFLARYKVRQSFSENPNGSRVAFTAPSNYVEGSEMVFRDGMLMMSGSANDYVLTPPNKITFNSEDPPGSDEVLLITYVSS